MPKPPRPGGKAPGYDHSQSACGPSDTSQDGFFDSLAPCSFRFVNGDRVHIGMISQDVEERMEQCGIDSMELAAFIKSPDENGGYRYGLRYSEFISLLIDQVQKLKKRVRKLEETA